MTIFNCTFVSVEARNIPVFLSDRILPDTNCKNGLLFSSYATASVQAIHEANCERPQNPSDNY